MLPNQSLCRSPPLLRGVLCCVQGLQHPLFLLHCSGCRFWSPFPLRCKSELWSASMRRSCDRGRRCSCQHSCRRKRRCGWYSPFRYRWVRLRLRYSCDLLPEFPCRLCSRILSRCRMLPSLPRCRLQPCRRDVQGHDRGHQHLWFQLHHSGCSNGFLHPFLYKSVQWSLSIRQSYDRGHLYNLQHLILVFVSSNQSVNCYPISTIIYLSEF